MGPGEGGGEQLPSGVGQIMSPVEVGKPLPEQAPKEVLLKSLNAEEKSLKTLADDKTSIKYGVDSPEGPIQMPEKKLHTPEEFSKLDIKELSEVKDWLFQHAPSQEPNPHMYWAPKVNIYDLGPSDIDGIRALDKQTRSEFYDYLINNQDFKKRIIDSGRTPEGWVKWAKGISGDDKSTPEPKYYQENLISFENDAQKLDVFKQLKDIPAGSFVRTIEKSPDGGFKVIFEPPADAQSEVSYIFVSYDDTDKSVITNNGRPIDSMKNKYVMDTPRGVKIQRISEDTNDINPSTICYAVTPQVREYFTNGEKPKRSEHDISTLEAVSTDKVIRTDTFSVIENKETGADSPNLELIYIQGAERTGLTPAEYQNLTEQGVQDIDALVKEAGLSGARKLIELDRNLRQGEKDHQNRV